MQVKAQMIAFGKPHLVSDTKIFFVPDKTETFRKKNNLNLLQQKPKCFKMVRERMYISKVSAIWHNLSKYSSKNVRSSKNAS